MRRGEANTALQSIYFKVICGGRRNGQKSNVLALLHDPADKSRTPRPADVAKPARFDSLKYLRGETFHGEKPPSLPCYLISFDTAQRVLAELKSDAIGSLKSFECSSKPDQLLLW